MVIAKTFALFSTRQLLGCPLVKRILYTKYEHPAIAAISAASIVIAFILSYVYGVELLLNPWGPNILVDAVLGFFLILLLVTFAFSPVKGLSLPPGYEFLLHQPIAFNELILGIALGFVLQSLMVFVLVAFIPLTVFLFNVASCGALQLLKFVTSFILLLVYIMACYTPFMFLLDIVKTSLLKRRREHSFLPIQVFVFVYVFVGISHSIILSIDSNSPTISSILTMPIKALYIVAFEISKFIGFTGYILGLIAISGVHCILLKYLGSLLSVEDFMSIKDVYEIQLAKRLEKESKRKPLVSWTSPEEVLKQILIDLSPLNPRNSIKRYIVAASITACAALALRMIFTLDIAVEYLGAFFGSMAGAGTMFAYIPLVNELLFNDLRSLWVLKVYSRRDLPFVKILNTKYLSYLGIVLTVLSSFMAIVFQNFYLMLLPLLNLPFICLSVNLLIVFGVKYLRKHKGKPPIYFGVTGSMPLDVYATAFTIPVLPLMIGLSLFASLIANEILTGLNFALAVMASILSFAFLSSLLIKPITSWFTNVELY